MSISFCFRNSPLVSFWSGLWGAAFRVLLQQDILQRNCEQRRLDFAMMLHDRAAWNPSPDPAHASYTVVVFAITSDL
jgi:hypothetical protein